MIHKGVAVNLCRKEGKMKSILLLVCLFQAGISTGDSENFIQYYETAHAYHTLIESSAQSITTQVHFNAHGRKFHLHLTTNQHLFTPDFQLRVHDKDGNIKTKKVDTRHIVIGHLIGDKSSSLAHGKISKRHFEGIIHIHEETYHVEPIERYISSIENDHNVVVYKLSDVAKFNSTCGNSKLTAKLHHLQQSGGYFHKNGNQLRKRQSATDDNTCTIHVYADYEFYSNIGNNDEATTLDTMALHITESDAIYRGTSFDNSGTGYGVAITAANIITANVPSDSNPLYGTFTVDELLQAFASINFDSSCLGHLFTYRDFSGTVGLAYVADPNGAYAGGICQKRTQTYGGQLNLNTGLTTLLNFRRPLPQAVSVITTAHEIGHNFGSPHDPSGECSPGGSQGNYIMYPTATDGNLPNNVQFSPCSRNIMGQTISSKGTCFVPKPLNQVCGNSIVEGTEECDCGSNVTCHENDPCCKPGECLLKDGATCSPHKYACCINCSNAESGTICNKGDECLEAFPCTGFNESCPEPVRKNLTFCNYDNNVCIDGVCSGSVCLKYNATLCFCTDSNKLCDVCCRFTSDGPCMSLFDVPNTINAIIQSGFPCKDFTGYCDDNGECLTVDTNIPLDDLRNIIPSLTSIVNWLRDNWYWVLVGVVVTIIVIVLLQVTYRRKKKKQRDDTDRTTDAATEHLRLLENQRRQNEEATRL